MEGLHKSKMNHLFTNLTHLDPITVVLEYMENENRSNFRVGMTFKKEYSVIIYSPLCFFGDFRLKIMQKPPRNVNL